jgi:hypothetical protein
MGRTRGVSRSQERKKENKKEKGRVPWRARPAWPAWPAWAMRPLDGDLTAPDRHLLHVYTVHADGEEKRGGQGLPAGAGARRRPGGVVKWRWCVGEASRRPDPSAPPLPALPSS